jgi:hypothetical protein
MLRKVLLILGLFCAPAHATISIVAHTGAVSAGGGNTVVTPAINNTGANFGVAVVADYNFVNPLGPITDSNSGNVWIATTSYDATYCRVTIFYSTGPTFGSSETFTYTKSGSFPSMNVATFGGVLVPSPLDQGNGAAGNATSIQTGNITPTTNNQLIIAGLNFNGTETISIDTGFTITDQQQFNSGNNFGGAMAYLVQGSAGAINPTWTFSGGSADTSANIASFKAAIVVPTTNAPFFGAEF